MASKSEGMSDGCKYIYGLTLIVGALPFLSSDETGTGGGLFGLGLIFAALLIWPINLREGSR